MTTCLLGLFSDGVLLHIHITPPLSVVVVVVVVVVGLPFLALDCWLGVVLRQGTPNKQALERFGTLGADGLRRPFHAYHLRQAVSEGHLIAKTRFLLFSAIILQFV